MFGDTFWCLAILFGFWRETHTFKKKIPGRKIRQVWTRQKDDASRCISSCDKFELVKKDDAKNWGAFEKRALVPWEGLKMTQKVVKRARSKDRSSDAKTRFN